MKFQNISSFYRPIFLCFSFFICFFLFFFFLFIVLCFLTCQNLSVVKTNFHPAHSISQSLKKNFPYQKNLTYQKKSHLPKKKKKNPTYQKKNSTLKKNPTGEKKSHLPKKIFHLKKNPIYPHLSFHLRLATLKKIPPTPTCHSTSA